jgi:serine/threonine-protein kinase
LPDEELVAAIATAPPAAPHLLNPLAPRSLSDIALKLLEKRPEDRYPDTDALLQMLEKAAEHKRASPAWKLPLFKAGQGPVESVSTKEEEPARLPDAVPEGTESRPPVEKEETRVEGQQEAPAAPARPHRARRPLVLLTGVTVLGLALWLARSTLPPPEALLPGSGHSEKGSPPMSTTPPSPSSSFLAAWLCAVVGIGCSAVQVKPPEPEDCPLEASQAMFQQLKVREFSDLRAVVDINQPGKQYETGVYQDGPIIGRLTRGDGDLPEGTLLHGHLWSGPDIYEIDSYPGKDDVKHPAVLGRYTLAVLPDGRKYPVCIVLGDPGDGRVPMSEGSKPGAAVLGRELPVSAVRRWP